MDILTVYNHWIDLFKKEAERLRLSEDQLQMALEFYRPPTSEDDYMFLIYSHDSPASEVMEWRKYDEEM